MIEEDRCAVCDDPTSTSGNQILYCDGKLTDGENCDMPVHQACYGVKVIPEDEWYCDRCKATRSNKPVNVVCCPMVAGAIKRTQHSGKFMHIVCGAYHDDVKHEQFPFYYINKNIDTKECYICLKRQGLCLKCNVPGCTKYFHATCGVNTGIISLGYPMPVGDPIKCLEHQGSDIITPQSPAPAPTASTSTSSTSSASSSSSASPLFIPKRSTSTNLNERPSKIHKDSRFNSESSSSSININKFNNNNNSYHRGNDSSNSISSNSNGLAVTDNSYNTNSNNIPLTRRTPSQPGGLASTSRVSSSLSSTSNPSFALPSASSSTLSNNNNPVSHVPSSINEIDRYKKELEAKTSEIKQLTTRLQIAEKELHNKQAENKYLKPRYDEKCKDLQRAKEKLKEKESIEKRLEESKSKIERMHRDLQSQKEFKKLVTEIFMSLNIRLPSNIAPSTQKMDEYVGLLRDILSRTGPPSENEYLQIVNLATKLATKRT